MRSEESTLIFNLCYSEARSVGEGVTVIEVDSFPYIITGVNSLPLNNNGELSLRVRPAKDAGRCHIYISTIHMMLRTENGWLYSYRKGTLFTKGDYRGWEK